MKFSSLKLFLLSLVLLKLTIITLTLRSKNKDSHIWFIRDRWIDEQKKLAGVSPESPV